MKMPLFFVWALALSLVACNKDNDPPAVTNFASGFVGVYGNLTKDGQRVNSTIIITPTDINEIKFNVGSDVYYGKTTSSTAFEIVAGTLGNPSLILLKGGGGVLTGNSLD